MSAKDLLVRLTSEKQAYDKIIDWAFKNDDGELLSVLFEAGLTTGAVNNNTQENYLHRAVRLKKPNAVRACIQAGCGLDAQNKSTKLTPLLLAIREKHLEIAEILLQAGARTDIGDKSGVDAIALAAAKPDDINRRFLDLLFQYPVNTASRSTNGQSPLHLLIYNQHTKHAKRFIEQCADVNLENDKGVTPLMVAIERAGENDFELVDLLVAKLQAQGVDINEPNSNGISPWLHAVRVGRPDMMARLQELGARIDVRDNQGGTGLIHAAYQNHHAIIADLVRQGLDPNTPDDRGNTALHVAAAKGNLASVDVLLKLNADPSTPNEEGQTPMDLARAVTNILVEENDDAEKIALFKWVIRRLEPRYLSMDLHQLPPPDNSGQPSLFANP